MNSSGGHGKNRYFWDINSKEIITKKNQGQAEIQGII